MVRQEKNQQSKTAILNAAITEFGTHGYSGASLNTAFAQAGISKGKVYHYYENNDQIYLACVDACFDALMSKLQTDQGEKPAGFSISLQNYSLRRWEFFQSTPAFAQIFLEAVQSPPEHLREEIKNRKAPFDRFNLSVFRTQLASLKLREGVSEADAMAYFQTFQEVFHQMFTKRIKEDPEKSDMNYHEQELRRTLDILLYGIAQEATQ